MLSSARISKFLLSSLASQSQLPTEGPAPTDNDELEPNGLLSVVADGKGDGSPLLFEFIMPEDSTNWAILYACFFVIGTTLNCFVLWRMWQSRRKEKEQYHSGIGMCLFAMALLDLTSLSALFLQLLAGTIFSLPKLNQLLGTVAGIALPDLFCKATAFVAHTAYTESMWCWVLMSTLRYMATNRPLQYFSLWRFPRMAFVSLFVLSMPLHSWLLYSVWHNDSGGCVQNFTNPSRAYNLIDILVSYVLPILILLKMDLKVLCRHRKPADPMLQIVVNRPNGVRKRIVHRFLLITSTNIILNLPANVLRLLLTIGLLDGASPSPLLEVAQFIFFSQFIFNALYLSSFIYERHQFSKSNSSRQLSISIRYRLENGEGGHFLRDRASTISCRASTPVPVPIKSANSCCTINFLSPTVPFVSAAHNQSSDWV